MYARQVKVRSSTPKDIKRTLLNYDFGNMFYFANVRATRARKVDSYYISIFIVVDGKIMNVSREMAYILEENLGGHRTQYIEVRDGTGSGDTLIRRISMALNEGVILKEKYSFQWL